jgi:hypothetical protein
MFTCQCLQNRNTFPKAAYFRVVVGADPQPMMAVVTCMDPDFTPRVPVRGFVSDVDPGRIREVTSNGRQSVAA